MFAEILSIVLGGLMVVVGLIGAVVPVVPGPVLAAGALFIVSAVGGWEIYSWAVLIGWSVAALIAQIMDNILPARAAGRAGAGRGGVWGSVLGMLVGTLVFPPFGVFIGAFLGALGGEILFHRDNREPLKAALAVFRGTLGAIVLKLAVVGAIAVVFVRGSIRLL